MALKLKAKRPVIFHVTNEDMSRLTDDEQKIMNFEWSTGKEQKILIRFMSMKHLCRAQLALERAFEAQKRNIGKSDRISSIGKVDAKILEIYREEQQKQEAELVEIASLKSLLDAAITIRHEKLGHTKFVEKPVENRKSGKSYQQSKPRKNAKFNGSKNNR